MHIYFLITLLNISIQLTIVYYFVIECKTTFLGVIMCFYCIDTCDIWKFYFSFCPMSLIFLFLFYLISPTLFLSSIHVHPPVQTTAGPQPWFTHTWPTLTWNTRCTEMEEEEKMKRPDALLVLTQYIWRGVERNCDFMRLIPLLHILNYWECSQYETLWGETIRSHKI